MRRRQRGPDRTGYLYTPSGALSLMVNVMRHTYSYDLLDRVTALPVNARRFDYTLGRRGIGWRWWNRAGGGPATATTACSS